MKKNIFFHENKLERGLKDENKGGRKVTLLIMHRIQGKGHHAA